MSDRPFDGYTFLYHFPSGHGAGGMEHAYGTAIDMNARALSGDMMPVASVSAHEFFHLWNVKRIRPASLEPVDYQRAMDTRALWFSEGVTSTVGDMLLSRAGLIGERQYIDRVAARSANCSRARRTRGSRSRSRASTRGSRATRFIARRSAASATTTRVRWSACCSTCGFANLPTTASPCATCSTG